jgi:hypothetical protein
MRSPMTLFDHDTIRLDNAPAPHVHNSFTYINASARPEMEAIRDLWESWFAEYPDDAKASLRRRFRGDGYNSAAFELYVHAILLAHGYGITVHAPEPGKSTEPLPDFGVTLSDGTVVDVEACGVHTEAPPQRIQRFQAEIADAVNAARSPFLLRLRFPKVGNNQPAASKLGKRVAGWLQSDEFVHAVAEVRLSGGRTVTQRFEDADWTIAVVADCEIPLDGDCSTKRPLGSVTTAAYIPNIAESIEKAVRKKARDYGERPHGLVVAVNAHATLCDADDYAAALVGPMWSTISDPDGGVTTARRWGGAWFNGDGTAKNTRVSCVVGCWNVTPSTALVDTPIVFHHPGAKRPANVILSSLPSAQLIGESFAMQPAGSMRDLYRLHDDWPREGGFRTRVTGAV